MKNYSVHHQKDDSYYIIDKDTGVSYSFEAYYHVTKESTPPSFEYPSEPAEYYVSTSSIEIFDEEGMSLGETKSKITVKQIHGIMEDYFKDDADDFHLTLTL